MGISVSTQVLERLKGVYSENHLPATNLNAILNYIRFRKNEGWAEDTVVNDLKTLIEFSRMTTKPFEEVNQEDLYEFFDYLNGHCKYSTARLHKVKLRLFFRYISRDDLVNVCIAKQRKSSSKLPEDLLTTEDIEKLIDTASSLRDKAFIALLYESGARKGEILDIQIKHIQFDENGCVVTLPKGKTGARRIRIIFSTGYLRNWLDNHPDKQNRDAPVWASTKYPNKAMSYYTAWGNIKRIAKKAGIQKPVHLHFFRHVRASHLAKTLTEAQLKVYLGWSAGSNMAATYVHLSGKDVDEAIFRANGKEIPGKDKKLDNILKTISCPRCKQMQDSKAQFCFKCGLPLTTEATNTEKTAETDLLKLIESSGLMAELVKKLQSQLST